MPQLLPLRGLRYQASAGPLSDLLAPPYDVISPRQQDELRRRSPYNAVHLELSEGGPERYATVAARLAGWAATGVVARDATPSLYVYEQRFSYGGQEHTRRAVLVGVEAQPWDEGAVKPHEYTMSGPKEDRLSLLLATKTQFSPVFMLARDRAGQLRQFIEATASSRDADAEGTSIDGESHRLWVVEADRIALRTLAPLLPESFYIADGHHRYETAVNYRDHLAGERVLERDHPARFTMAAIIAADDPGLVIRPIYRWVPRAAPSDWRALLEPVFEVSEVADRSEAALLSALASGDNSFVALGLAPGATHLLRPRSGFDFGSLPGNPNSAEWAAVAPNLLRLAVLNPLWQLSDADLQAGAVEYLHDIPEVLDATSSAQGVAFLLNPVRVKDVIDLADKGERMPQKSTFFHPKLGTGLVFNPLYP